MPQTVWFPVSLEYCPGLSQPRQIGLEFLLFLLCMLHPILDVSGLSANTHGVWFFFNSLTGIWDLAGSEWLSREVVQTGYHLLVCHCHCLVRREYLYNIQILFLLQWEPNSRYVLQQAYHTTNYTMAIPLNFSIQYFYNFCVDYNQLQKI